jgi:hypothetical protein
MRLGLGLVILLVPLLVFGCGGGGGSSDESQIESVLRGYVGAYLDSRPADMYTMLDSQSQAGCNEENFTAVMQAAREALGETPFEIVDVSQIVIEGDSATAVTSARIGGELADPTQNTLLKESGAWKLELPFPNC